MIDSRRRTESEHVKGNKQSICFEGLQPKKQKVRINWSSNFSVNMVRCNKETK